tara:strand:+ start:12779 stop:13525 length:747 start_codon:yes stop_codon:yes gene_type:complete
MAKKKKNLADMIKAPRKIDIEGQLHMLAWITADEGKALKLLGGAGTPGPMGIPQFGDIGGGETGAGQPGSSQEDDAAQSSVGESTGYSGSISQAMADSSPSNVSDDGTTAGGLEEDIDAMQEVQAGLEGRSNDPIGGNESDPIKKAIQEVAEKIPDESPLTDAMKAYYGKGIGTSTIDMSTAAGRATSLANMTSPSTSAIGGKFDPATGRYIFPDGRIFDTATGKFLPMSQSNKIEGLDLFRPIEGVK